MAADPKGEPGYENRFHNRPLSGGLDLSCFRPERLPELHSATPSRRGKGNKVQEAVQAENKEDHARQISGDCGSGFHNQVLLFDWQPLHGVNHIEVNIVDDGILPRDSVFL